MSEDSGTSVDITGLEGLGKFLTDLKPLTNLLRAIADTTTYQTINQECARIYEYNSVDLAAVIRATAKYIDENNVVIGLVRIIKEILKNPDIYQMLLVDKLNSIANDIKPEE